MEQEILFKLCAIVGHDHVITEQLNNYLCDWRGRYLGQALAVVKPQNTQQIAELVNLCHANNIKIIPQGGNIFRQGVMNIIT